MMTLGFPPATGWRTLLVLTGLAASAPGIAENQSVDDDYSIGVTSGSEVVDARWAGGFGRAGDCDHDVYAMTRAEDGSIFVGGDFTRCGNVEAFRVARFDPATGSWSSLDGELGNGTSGPVRALAVSADAVYVGGEFAQIECAQAWECEGLDARNLARWDRAEKSWSVPGDEQSIGVGNSVYALVLSGDRLFVGGSFREVNCDANSSCQTPATRAAVWNVQEQTWLPLGQQGAEGVSDTVRAMAILDGDLYLGGDFRQVACQQASPCYGTVTNYLARYDPDLGIWHGIGTGGRVGVRGPVYALEADSVESDVHIGGNFIGANCSAALECDARAWNLARWQTTDAQWGVTGEVMGGGVWYPAVQALEVSEEGLYVGGNFSWALPYEAGGVALWTGTGWSFLGSEASSGVNWEVHALSIVENDVLVGGRFSRVFHCSEDKCGEKPVDNIVRWNTEKQIWSAAGSGGGQGLSGPVVASVIYQGDLVVGGWFTQAGEVEVLNLARWDGTQWHAIGQGEAGGANNAVMALAVSGDDLYVGGIFTEVDCSTAIDCNGLPANRVARWDGTQWHALETSKVNGLDGPVGTMTTIDNDLFIGGTFERVSCIDPIDCPELISRGIIRWDGDQWQSLEGGVNGKVLSLERLGNDLFVAGSFSTAGSELPVTARSIARWNRISQTWHPLHPEQPMEIFGAVGLSVTDEGLFVGGSFEIYSAGVLLFSNLALWDFESASWSGFDSAPDIQPHTLYWSGSALYAGDSEALVRWDGSTWTNLGSGVSGSVRTLSMDSMDQLFVGGRFFAAGNKPSRNVGQYRTRGAVSVSLSGNADDQVLSQPAGIQCPESCSARFEWDQPITLTAVPSEEQDFVGWSHPSCTNFPVCTIMLTEDLNIEALFEESQRISEDRFEQKSHRGE